ncbi:P-loop containing nucleoside triphosphate hydrolase protein [Trichoderma chlorosporum]
MVLSNTSHGDKCEFKTYHHTTKKNGTISIDNIRDTFGPSSLEWKDASYALVINRFFGEKAQLEKTTLLINSSHLLKTFQEVIRSYPTVSSDFSSPFELVSPFRILIHFWDELDQRRLTTQNPEERMHLNLLFEFMNHEVGTERTRLQQMIRNNHIPYLSAWYLFRPGDLIYTTVMGQPWLLKCEKTSYEASLDIGPYLDVFGVYTDYNGETVGKAVHTIRIRQKEYFGGDNPASIKQLPVYPFQMENVSDNFEALLRERGKKFLLLKDKTVITYNGIANHLQEWPDDYWHHFMDDWDIIWLPYTETGRMVLHHKSFREDFPKAYPTIVPVEAYDSMLCPPFTFCFSINRKEWSRVLIDNIHSVHWKKDAWQSLIIPHQPKLILEALVTSHAFPESPRDQITQKGKGLVILLHGEPGSGKTLTAETAAEATQKALLPTSVAELHKSTSSFGFERRLRLLLRYATIWQAIVLLDEADVFLEARGENQSERNTLVAIFLRELEYFNGIVFLTTNRIESFDKAMKSRVHFSLGFSSPDMKIRELLWKQQLKSVPPNEVDLNEDDVIDSVRSVELNGREISNMINTARTFARFQKMPLQLPHLKIVLQAHQTFNDGLGQEKTHIG